MLKYTGLIIAKNIYGGKKAMANKKSASKAGSKAKSAARTKAAAKAGKASANGGKQWIFEEVKTWNKNY